MCTTCVTGACGCKTFNPNKPVMARDGRPARIVDQHYMTINGPKLLVIYEERPGVNSFNFNNLDGSAAYNVNSLVNVPKRVVRYMNVGTNKTLRGEQQNLVSRAEPYYVCGFTSLRLEFEDGELVSVSVDKERK